MGICVNRDSVDIVSINNENDIKKDDLNDKNNGNDLLIQKNCDNNVDNNDKITDNESGPILKLLKQNVKQ